MGELELAFAAAGADTLAAAVRTADAAVKRAAAMAATAPAALPSLVQHNFEYWVCPVALVLRTSGRWAGVEFTTLVRQSGDALNGLGYQLVVPADARRQTLFARASGCRRLGR